MHHSPGNYKYQKDHHLLEFCDPSKPEIVNDVNN